MTLVMDGVVRRSGMVALPQIRPARRTAPVVSPIVNSRIGMDGIRRNVPTPREVLANLTATESFAEPADTLVMPTPALRDWRAVRQTAAFGLVATALVTSGVATGTTAIHTVATDLAAPTRAANLTIPAAKPTTPAATPQITTAAAVTPAAAGLQQVLSGFMASQPNLYSVVVKNLSTGETATINSGQVIESASMYKLFVADQVYHQVDTGRLTMSQIVPGAGYTVQGCLKLMITISDNTCGRALRTLTGLSSNSSVLKNDGYTSTVLTGDYPQTSAEDIAKLYERLYNNTLNSPSSNDAFLALLKGQLVNNRLPQGLPAGTVMAHKTGDLDGYMHDGGIVYGPNANYLVVMMGAPGARPSAFANLSAQLWSHFER